jgi:hypothetical protein
MVNALEQYLGTPTIALAVYLFNTCADTMIRNLH